MTTNVAIEGYTLDGYQLNNRGMALPSPVFATLLDSSVAVQYTMTAGAQKTVRIATGANGIWWDFIASTGLVADALKRAVPANSVAYIDVPSTATAISFINQS